MQVSPCIYGDVLLPLQIKIKPQGANIQCLIGIQSLEKRVIRLMMSY